MSSQSNIQPRYMTSTKKHYYLASVDENVQQLIKEEIQELTKVLIELKSQYDVLTRESANKKQETEELTKKIKMLEKMDKKAIKNIETAEKKTDKNEITLEQKKTELNEALYQKKTLQKQMEKIKSDILLTNKKIILQDNVTKRLKKNYEHEKFKETQIKERKNKVHSKVEEQSNNNKYNNNEQNLQLQYYKTIIQQKNMFIKSADERKERQKKIAEEAKNDSADKLEIKKREILGLLKLYNKFLKTKIEKALKSNEKIEETFIQIRDITGTSSLKTIIETILNKDKKYNDRISKVSEIQHEIEIFDSDIQELEKKITNLKNDVLCKETDDNKSISTIPTSIIEQEEEELINKENELKLKLNLLQEKQEKINLIFEKVNENINELIKNDEKIFENYNKSSFNNETTDFRNKNQNLDENTFVLNESKTSILNVNTSQSNENGLNLNNENNENNNENQINLQDNNNENNNNNNENNNNNNENNNNNNENNNNNDNNTEIIIQDNNNKIVSDETDELIKKFKEFLENLYNKCYELLLMNSKIDFTRSMAETGNLNVNKEVRKKTRKITRKQMKEMKEKNENKLKEIEFDKDDIDDERMRTFYKNEKRKNNAPSSDIFQRFMEEQQEKVREFVYKPETKKNKP
jgi:hypothetical protein